jgi:hypothetical protein
MGFEWQRVRAGRGEDACLVLNLRGCPSQEVGWMRTGRCCTRWAGVSNRLFGLRTRVRAHFGSALPRGQCPGRTDAGTGNS